MARFGTFVDGFPYHDFAGAVDGTHPEMIGAGSEDDSDKGSGSPRATGQ